MRAPEHDHFGPVVETARPIERLVSRHFALEALPLPGAELAYFPSVFAALEPGASLTIFLGGDERSPRAVTACFKGETSEADARSILTGLWPTLSWVAQEPPHGEQAEKPMQPLMPILRKLFSPNGGNRNPAILPHNPQLWPWRIGQAMHQTIKAGAGLIITVAKPWSAAASLAKLEKLARQVQIAELVDPSSAWVAQACSFVSLLRADTDPVEISIGCSADMPIATRRLVAILLFGAPHDENPNREGVLCRASDIPPVLHPLMQTSWEGCATFEHAMRLAETSTGQPVFLTRADRMRHLYVLGGTGTGKSTLMQDLIMQDLENGEPLLLLDPHGDLSADIVARMPAARRGDLIVADPSRGELRLPLVPDYKAGLAFEREADGLVSLFMDVLYGFQKEAFGPLFELYFRNAFLLLCQADAELRELSNIARVFEDRSFRQHLLDICVDEPCRAFWQTTAARTEGEWSLANMTAYVTSKFSRLIGSPAARAIFSGREEAFDLASVLDGNPAIIIPCPKGKLGEGLSRLVLAVILMKLRMAAMARQDRAMRSLLRVYIDEFQGARGSELALLLAEGRKYGLSLTLANQSIAQLGGVAEGTLGAAVLANAGNLAMFRLGGPDAQTMAPWLGGRVDWRHLCNQPDHHFTARLLQGGRPRLLCNLRKAARGREQ